MVCRSFSTEGRDPMRLRPTSLLLLTLALAAGCANRNIDVEAAPEATFGDYSTFTVLRPSSTTVPRELMEAAHDSMVAELARRGYREVPRDEADLQVSVHGEISEKVRIGQYQQVIPKEQWVGWYPYTDAYVFKTRELSVVASDRRRRAVVWQGRLERKTPLSHESTPDAVREAIRKVLRKFPRAR
jgi:hypothetical protein